MLKEIFKSKKKIISLLCLFTFFTSIFSTSAGAFELPKKSTKRISENFVKEETSRNKINFNREWKFFRGDVEGGQNVDFDHSSWTDVGLPHNFSIPYNMESTFYVGYGWYRKTFDVPENWDGKRINIEFEGAFQVAEVFVNGQSVGTHEGGYTGFTFDITDYVNKGENLIAVRVNNIWRPNLAPRAGDHQFTGGIYRDVYLNVTDDVHVTWYGTFVSTPDLLNPDFHESAVNVLDSYTSDEDIKENIKKKRSNVNVQTEVKNQSEDSATVKVKQEVVNKENKVVAEFESDEKILAPGETYNFNDTSEQISGIEIWDIENPYVYTVHTTVYKEGVAVDTYESPLGFRSAQYRNDGFYLNGEKILLNGANVHQDHGGWADAVTNEGFSRDVSMIKEAGMNFIRGSHYPHDTSFAEACDEEGILFWSEAVFWGMGGCNGKDDPATMTASDWFKDAYPQNPEDEAAFEESCMRALGEMIRVNRNHPSIINWSMGNEVFFTADKTQNKAKALVNKMRNLSHKLDPTRKAAMGGVQRQGYDKIEVCDIAGYNGDGGTFTNLTMPNLVAEYGSKTADRPGEFRPFYHDIAKPGTTDEYVLKENSAGLTLWCAFHHGTIGGDGLAKMGMIDYYRLPLNTWYWYREQNTGVAEEASISGKATKIGVKTSTDVIPNDGTGDTQIIVTMQDDKGNWVNDSQNVVLRVVDGPGVFPTGKEYEFKVGNTMRDGRAAIEFRSFFSGETTIVAMAPGLPETEFKITTLNATGDVEGEEPDNFLVVTEEDTTAKIEEPKMYGADNASLSRPAFPSSNIEDRGLAADGNLETTWVAGKEGSNEYWMQDLEFTQYLYKIKLSFNAEPYPYKVEVATDRENGPWTTVSEYNKDTIVNRPLEESVKGLEARYVKITFTDVPEGEKAFLSECETYGVVAAQSPKYVAESVYLSDLDWSSMSNGWGIAGKDESCEGNPIRVGGVTYEKGLGFHANSEVVYNLDGKYSRFQAVAGIDNEVTGGNAIFKIFADDVLIYENEISGGGSDKIDLSVSGVNTLRLVTDKNGPDSQDHTDWADAKLLGAIRDISIKGASHKATFTSNTQELVSGKNFEAMIGLTNVDSSKAAYSASLALYNNEGSIVDVDVVRDYLSKGKKTSFNLSLNMPEDLTGYYAKLNIWNNNTLMPIANTTFISGSINKDARSNIESWTKIDGEDMIKVGNWKMWPDSSAYNGTETYTGDGDTPLTQDTSISYTFTGKKVKVGAKFDGGQVGADVYIDGKKAGSINNKQQGVNEYKMAWTSGELENSEHTIKLVPLGKFGLDFIEYSSVEEVPVVDKSELLSAIGEVLKIVEKANGDKYTEASTTNLSNATFTGFITYKETGSNEDGVKLATKNILNAIKALEAINVVDKNILIKLVNEAKALVKDAVEGVQIGEYHKGAKAKLLESISISEEVVNNDGATGEDVDKSVELIQKAVDEFNLLEITKETGDFNKNGAIDLGDLSIAAKYYGTNNSEYDLNKDGIVDKYEIEFISYKIVK